MECFGKAMGVGVGAKISSLAVGEGLNTKVTIFFRMGLTL
jgi:hypothetical protein